jgi:myosin heavy subunit
MFSDEELNDILRLLSAVLHLGNLKFQGKLSSRDLIRGRKLFVI